MNTHRPSGDYTLVKTSDARYVINCRNRFLVAVYYNGRGSGGWQIEANASEIFETPAAAFLEYVARETR